MLTGTPKFLLIACLLLSLAGQVWAGARIACPMMNGTAVSMVAMSEAMSGMNTAPAMDAVDHSQHMRAMAVLATDAPEQSQALSADCCGEGACTYAQCNSSPPAAYLVAQLQLPAESFSANYRESSDTYAGLDPARRLRPPISR